MKINIKGDTPMERLTHAGEHDAVDLPAPHFAQKDTTYSLVTVTLRNNVKHRIEWVDGDGASIIGAQLAQTLTQHERRALNFIAEHGKGHATEISRVCAIDWATARKMLAKLQGKGILKAYFVLAERPKPSEDESA